MGAWEGEDIAGDNIFYALSSQFNGAVPINRYCGHAWGHVWQDSTFHPSPAWTQEYNCGDAIFYAYTDQRPGTVEINRYWEDDKHRSTFHPAPEWPNEHDQGD